MNIKPIGKRVLVQKIKAQQETKGSILLLNDSVKIKHEGTVIALGCEDMPFKIGDHVILASYAGYLVGKEEDELSIINEVDIIGVYC